MSAARYPVLLDLQDRDVLVAGGGKVATRKVRRLLDAGARVRLVSPELTPELEELAREEHLVHEARPAVPEDVDGARLAFLTTSDPETNAALEAAAEKTGVPVNRADVRGGGDFQVPAEASHGDVRVWVSTGGRSPKLARLVRQRVEALLAEDFRGVLEGLEQLRRELPDRGLSPEERSRFWERYPDEELMAALRRGEPEEIGREVERCVSSLSA